jgi:hypothetical protein
MRKLFLLIAIAHFFAGVSAAPVKPRVVVMSDFPPLDVIPGGANYGPAEKRSDPDDVQSMIRFLLYGNDFDIDGLIASAGTVANVASKQGILDILYLYDRIDENLRRHDSQYPTAAKLRSVTWEGRSGTYGRPAKEILGVGMDSMASDAIIALVDRADPRPVWFCAWGGSRELAQAIWKVQATRTPAELERFLAKVRLYLIAKQDGSAQWLLDSFPNLFIILSETSFQGMFNRAKGADVRLSDLAWLNEHIRKGHGVLGAMYPECAWDIETPGVTEGDSPSFLHLASSVRGLNDAERPDQPGWGGQFIRRDASRNHWYDHPAGPETVWRWRARVQEDFARRADWMRDPPLGAAKAEDRYRVIILTDMTHDDGNSLIRYLYYTPHFDTEAIIVTPQLPDYRHDSELPWNKAQTILDAYRAERDQLIKHDPRFPTHADLARVTKKGRGALPIIWLTETGTFSGDIAGRRVTNSWGKIQFQDWIGEGVNPNGEPKDSEGSEWLRQVFEREDDRPIFIQCWGGPITLAQALFRYQQHNSPDKLRALLDKLILYSIHLQDITFDYFIDLDEVRKSKCAHLGETRSSYQGERLSPRTLAFDMGHFWKYLKAMDPAKVQGHGPMSRLYDGGGEGDTPAFLYLVSAVLGLNDPQDPTQGSWGNMFYPMGIPFPNGYYDTCRGAQSELERWIADAGSSFLGRLQWAIKEPGAVNHPPTAVVNGQAGNQMIRLQAEPGSQLTLDASMSSDSDGNALRFRWFHYAQAGTYNREIRLARPEEARQLFAVPPDLGKKQIHLVLELRDDGLPALVSYRRVIIQAGE